MVKFILEWIGVTGRLLIGLSLRLAMVFVPLSVGIGVAAASFGISREAVRVVLCSPNMLNVYIAVGLAGALMLSLFEVIVYEEG